MYHITQKHNVNTITSHELKSKLLQNEITLIDVREPYEHQMENIGNSYLIPLNEISLKKLPVENKSYVIYCRSGKRSEEACRRLLNENPHLEVYNLEGGILDFNS